MTQSAITAQVHETFDIHRNLSPQITLNLAFPVDDFTNLCHFSFGEIIGPGIKFNPGLAQDLLGRGAADAEDVGESHLNPFISR